MPTQESFNDRLRPKANSANLEEHNKALNALQAEIEYHRRHDENDTYLGRAVRFIHDGSADSLNKLEIAMQREKDFSNSVSRKEVSNLVEKDQEALRQQTAATHATSIFSAIALTSFGGSMGKTFAAMAIAADSTHVNNPLWAQPLEAVSGFALGIYAGKFFDKGMAMNPLWGLPLSIASFPVAHGLGELSVLNKGFGNAPNVEDIYAVNPGRGNFTSRK